MFCSFAHQKQASSWADLTAFNQATLTAYLDAPPTSGLFERNEPAPPDLLNQVAK